MIIIQTGETSEGFDYRKEYYSFFLTIINHQSEAFHEVRAMYTYFSLAITL